NRNVRLCTCQASREKVKSSNAVAYRPRIAPSTQRHGAAKIKPTIKNNGSATSSVSRRRLTVGCDPPLEVVASGDITIALRHGAPGTLSMKQERDRAVAWSALVGRFNSHDASEE